MGNTCCKADKIERRPIDEQFQLVPRDSNIEENGTQMQIACTDLLTEEQINPRNSFKRFSKQKRIKERCEEDKGTVIRNKKSRLAKRSNLRIPFGKDNTGTQRCLLQQYKGIAGCCESDSEVNFSLSNNFGKPQ